MDSAKSAEEEGTLHIELAPILCKTKNPTQQKPRRTNQSDESNIEGPLPRSGQKNIR